MKLISTNLLLLVFMILSCSKNDEYSDEVYMFIDSKYIETPSNIYPDKSLNVKIGDKEQDWVPLFNNSIEDFEYKEGFFYKILVKRTFQKNPPQDGSNVTYKLLNIIEKTKINEHEKE